MSRNAQQTLFALVEAFFADFLPQQRGASLHTVRAYRVSLKLLLHFIARRRKCEMAKLQLSDLNADAIADFLDHIEADRSNAAATRNCRHAALRSFVKRLLRNDLAHSLQYTQILAIPSKKARQKPATYLEPDDVRAIVAKPDRETPDGWCDYTLLFFLYNCGARVSEATDVRWNDLHMTAPRQVLLRGKGKKERLLPVWRETADASNHLRGLGAGGDHQHVFANRQRQPLTRDGVAYILSKYALNHWEGLERFLEDGRIELDTNSVERAMRPVWSFAQK